jgi:hypothetical protein
VQSDSLLLRIAASRERSTALSMPNGATSKQKQCRHFSSWSWDRTHRPQVYLQLLSILPASASPPYLRDLLAPFPRCRCCKRAQTIFAICRNSSCDCKARPPQATRPLHRRRHPPREQTRTRIASECELIRKLVSAAFDTSVVDAATSLACSLCSAVDSAVCCSQSWTRSRMWRYVVHAPRPVAFSHHGAAHAPHSRVSCVLRVQESHVLRNEMFVYASVLLCCMDLTGRWIDVNEVCQVMLRAGAECLGRCSSRATLSPFPLFLVVGNVCSP